MTKPGRRTTIPPNIQADIDARHDLGDSVTRIHDGLRRVHGHRAPSRAAIGRYLRGRPRSEEDAVARVERAAARVVEAADAVNATSRRPFHGFRIVLAQPPRIRRKFFVVDDETRTVGYGDELARRAAEACVGRGLAGPRLNAADGVASPEVLAVLADGIDDKDGAETLTDVVADPVTLGVAGWDHYEQGEEADRVEA
jgi:hypothetical protein